MRIAPFRNDNACDNDSDVSTWYISAKWFRGIGIAHSPDNMSHIICCVSNLNTNMNNSFVAVGASLIAFKKDSASDSLRNCWDDTEWHNQSGFVEHQF